MADARRVERLVRVEQAILAEVEAVPVGEAHQVDVRIHERLHVQRVRPVRLRLEAAAGRARALAVQRERADEAHDGDGRLAEDACAVAPQLGRPQAALQQRVLLAQPLRGCACTAVGHALRKALVDQAADVDVAAEGEHELLATALLAQPGRHPVRTVTFSSVQNSALSTRSLIRDAPVGASTDKCSREASAPPPVATPPSAPFRLFTRGRPTITASTCRSLTP